MESHGNEPITLNFTDGQCLQVTREFWNKNDLDRFDIVRANKINGYGIVFYGEYLSEEEKALLPSQQTETKEVQTEFSVILTSFGGSKLKVVKHVKEITGLGLRESMALVSNLETVKEGVSEVEANMIKERLEAEGATVELK